MRVGFASAVIAISATLAPAATPGESDRRGPIVQVVERVSPAVVNISTEQMVESPFRRPSTAPGALDDLDPGQAGDSSRSAGNSLGSGFVVDPRGYILTNEHVLWRATRINVMLSDGRRFEAQVIGVDPRSDLAVLKIESTDELPAIPLDPPGELYIGETVIAIGNPFGLANTVTTGVLSAVKRSIKAGDHVYSDFLQTDASISPGFSGGALLTINGDLIGVNTAILGAGSGISFAIPVDRARKVFDDLVRWGEVRVAWLGLEVRDLTDSAYAAMLEREGGEDPGGAIAVTAPGAQVRRVYPDGPAGAAGLAAGDLITQVGDVSITSRTDFETAISKFKSGDDVPIVYRKGSSERSAVVTATAFPVELSEDYLSDQLGIEVTDIPASLRERYPQRLPPDGVIVTNVRRGTRGYFHGLERGDILRGIDNRSVTDMPSLRQAVPRMVGREAVLLKVVRGRYQYNVTIDLT